MPKTARQPIEDRQELRRSLVGIDLHAPPAEGRDDVVDLRVDVVFDEGAFLAVQAVDARHPQIEAAETRAVEHLHDAGESMAFSVRKAAEQGMEVGDVHAPARLRLLDQRGHRR